MVTSAAPAEGKTTLSGCLAESLARAGYRTLLIDGDLRRPTAHDRYGTPPGPGVAEILRGEASVLACCYRVDSLGLWVLPAGRDSAAASELLPKGGWRGLVQQARELFDFVVVDTAPAAGGGRSAPDGPGVRRGGAGGAPGRQPDGPAGRRRQPPPDAGNPHPGLRRPPGLPAPDRRLLLLSPCRTASSKPNLRRPWRVNSGGRKPRSGSKSRYQSYSRSPIA